MIKLTTLEKLFFEQRLLENGFTILREAIEFAISENQFRYEYQLERGILSFTKEYINNEIVFTIHQYPYISNQDILPVRVNTIVFQESLTSLFRDNVLL